MAKSTEWIIRWRQPLIILTIILTLFFGYFLKDLEVDPDILNYLPASDPDVQLSTYIGKEYGGNLIAMVALETPTLFTARGWAELTLLTETLEKIDGINAVTSLTNIIDIKSEDDLLVIGPLLERQTLPPTPATWQAFQAYVLTKKLYREKLLSADGTTALVICQLVDDDEFDKATIARSIITTVNSLNLNGRTYFGGLPFYLLEISETILRDLKILVPLVILLIIVLLYLSFATLAGVFIPLLSVLISTIWTLGLMCLLKVPLTIVTDVIPVVLIAVGSAYSIHLLNKFYANKTFISAEKKTQLVLSDLKLPVFLAALTTIVGFLSFVFGSYLTMIQQFGLFSAIGVLFALLIAVTLVPALLSFIKSSPIPARKRNRFKTSGHNLHEGRFRFRPGSSKLMIGISLVVMVFGLLGIPRIQRKVDILDYFPADRRIRVTEEKIMNPKFGGSIPLQILVHGDLLAPEVLTEIQKVQNYLQTLDLVHNPFSILDLILELNAAMGEGWQIPDSREKVTNLWFFLEGEEIITQLINGDQTEAIIQANLVYAPMDELTALVTEINTFLAGLDPTLCRFEQAGMHVIYRNLDQSLLSSQIHSLLLSLVFILIIVTLLLRSLKGGLIGLIPIVFTLIVIFGFMGYSGIPLDIATVLVAGVSIGIGIDYSIHFLVRFRTEQKRMSVKSAVQETLKTTGKGIFVNMITVAGGFFIFIFAELVPLQRFGILVALTMLSSGFATLYLLPAVLLVRAEKAQFVTGYSSLVAHDE